VRVRVEFLFYLGQEQLENQREWKRTRVLVKNS